MIEKNVKQVLFFLENYRGGDKIDRLLSLSNKIKNLSELRVIPVYYAISLNKPSDLGFDCDDHLCFLNEEDAEMSDSDVIIRAVTNPDNLDITGIIDSHLLNTPETVRLTEYPTIDEIKPQNKKALKIIINTRSPSEIVNESVVTNYVNRHIHLFESYGEISNIDQANRYAAQAAYSMGSRIANKMFDVIDRSRNYINKNYSFEDENSFMDEYDDILIDESSNEFKTISKKDKILQDPSLQRVLDLI
jgi:hypothetical protein